jgi:hypothetical protein
MRLFRLEQTIGYAYEQPGQHIDIYLIVAESEKEAVDIFKSEIDKDHWKKTFSHEIVVKEITSKSIFLISE